MVFVNKYLITFMSSIKIRSIIREHFCERHYLPPVKICGKPLQFAKIYEILSTFSYAKLSAVWSQRVVKNPRNLLPLFAGEPDQRSGRYSASEY